jgi:hypothetical protein
MKMILQRKPLFLILPALVLMAGTVFAAENPLGRNNAPGSVGLQLGEQNGAIWVVKTVAGMPAAMGGAREGDMILGVDENSVAGQSVAEVAGEIVGRAGTVVKITVRHANGMTQEIALTRAAAQAPISQQPNERQEVAATDEPPLPKEFSLAGKCDAGRSLVCMKNDVKSARQMLLMTLDQLAGYFDERPALDACYGDKDDRAAVTSFQAKLKGNSMKGAIFASVGETGGTSIVIFDRQGASPAALARLAAAAAPVGNMQWTPTRLPDGSGALLLPEKWKLTGASNGALDAAGPNGQTISLGISFTIFTPEAEAAFHQPRAALGLPYQPTGFLVARFCEPAEAVKTLVPQFSKMSQAGGQPPFRLLSIIETTPLEDRQGHTAYVHLLAEIGTGEAAFRQESLVLVKCMPMGGGRWQYYSSQVTAPQALFQHDLPTMIKIWQSWRLDPNSVRERMNKALAVMSETREMLGRSAEYQDHVRAQSSAEWDAIITGYTTIIDKATGQHSDKNTANVKSLVDQMNEKAGYPQFKEMGVMGK